MNPAVSKPVPAPLAALPIKLLNVSFLLLLFSTTSFGIVCHCEGNLDELFPDARSLESAHPSLRTAARKYFTCTPGLGNFIECEGVCLMCAVTIDGIKGSKAAKGCVEAYTEERPPPPPAPPPPPVAPPPTVPVYRNQREGNESESGVNDTGTGTDDSFEPVDTDEVLGLLWDYGSGRIQNQNAREVPDFLFEMFMCNKEKCNNKIGHRTQTGPGKRPDECQNGANEKWHNSPTWKISALSAFLIFQVHCNFKLSLDFRHL